MITLRQCTSCRMTKPLHHAFNRRGTYDPSYRYKCKVCERESAAYRGRQWRMLNRRPFGRDREASGMRIHGAYDPRTRAIHTRCGGVMFHNQDGDFACINCGYVQYVKMGVSA